MPRRTREIFDNLQSFAGLLTPEGVVLEANRYALERASLSLDEVVGKPFWLTYWWDYSPESRAEIAAFVARAAAGESVRQEVMARITDGELIVVDFSLLPVFDGEGRVEWLVPTGVDITARRRAESDLRTFFELSPDLLAIADSRGYYLRLNPAWERTVGWSLEELRSRPFVEFVHPDDRDATIREATQLAGGVPTVAFENRYITKDGSYRILSWAAQPSGDRVYAVARDVTVRKSLEEQLHHAQRMESIGQVAGGVAHDFNNLLTAIIGYTDMLLDETPEGVRLEDLREIRKAAESAAGVTAQLLTFSRREVTSSDVVDPAQVINGLRRIIRQAVGEQVEVVILIAPQIGRVRLAATKLEQVLLNLVVNAADAMARNGKLTIECSAVHLGREYELVHAGVPVGPYVLISVSDTGVGMTPEVRRRIFEPFYTTKPSGKGTGLGLSTVYGIVTQAGGHVFAYSEPGLGSTFKVYMPVVAGPARALPADEVLPTTLAGSETVLVVEDEESVRSMVREVLHRHGYAVMHAGAPEEAILLNERFTGIIHLVLTDVVLPRADGRALIERLLQHRPSLKVLFMSGYTAATLEDKIELTPGINFLPKPFTPSALLRAVRRVLDRA